MRSYENPHRTRFPAPVRINPKSEIRNPKQIPNAKFKIPNRNGRRFEFRILNLFRISSFGFRIYAEDREKTLVSFPNKFHPFCALAGAGAAADGSGAPNSLRVRFSMSASAFER